MGGGWFVKVGYTLERGKDSLFVFKNFGDYPLIARIGRWVYNPLNKLVRRVIRIIMKNEFLAGLILFLITLGFSLLVVASQSTSCQIAFLIGGIVAVSLGIIMIGIVWRRLDDAEKEKNDTSDELKSAIQELTEVLKEIKSGKR